MLKTDFVIRTILDAHTLLKKTTDFSPRNGEINEALSLLVQTLSKQYTPEEENIILSNPAIQNIRPEMLKYLSKAECEMERYWADRFIQKPTLSENDFKEFWYWNNYKNLVDDEVKHLPYRGYTSKIQEFNIVPDDSIAFVGSGSLPLSAIMMSKASDMRVTCVDSDADACMKSRALINKAGMSHSIDVVCCSGEKYSYRKHPFVFIASLVPDKEKVLQQISKSERQNYVAIRSAEKLHTLLYEPVDEKSDELGCCNLVSRTHPEPEIINTTLFYHSNPGWHMDLESRRTKGVRYHKFGWGCRRAI